MAILENGLTRFWDPQEGHSDFRDFRAGLRATTVVGAASCDFCLVAQRDFIRKYIWYVHLPIVQLFSPSKSTFLDLKQKM